MSCQVHKLCTTALHTVYNAQCRHSLLRLWLGLIMTLSLLALLSAVNYTLFADRQEGVLQSRVMFESDVPMVVGTFDLNVGGDPECVTETAVLQVLWLGLGWCRYQPLNDMSVFHDFLCNAECKC